MLQFDKEHERKNFKDHVATLTDYGNIKILDFKNPKSSNYRIRFLFEEDYCRLHISGDLGELTAVNYDNMCYECFTDFTHSLGYFREKVKCHNRPFWNFDYDLAKEELKERLEELDPEPEDEDQTKEEYIDEIISDCLDDFGNDGLGRQAYDILSEIDADCFEWISDIGKVSSGILELYMFAFELAQEQLKQKGDSNGQQSEGTT